MKRPANNIGEKFDSLQAPLDKDRLWAKIRSHEDFPQAPQPRRRRFLWLFCFGLLVGGGMLAYFYSNPSSNSLMESEDLAAPYAQEAAPEFSPTNPKETSPSTAPATTDPTSIAETVVSPQSSPVNSHLNTEDQASSLSNSNINSNSNSNSSSNSNSKRNPNPPLQSTKASSTASPETSTRPRSATPTQNSTAPVTNPENTAEKNRKGTSDKLDSTKVTAPIASDLAIPLKIFSPLALLPPRPLSADSLNDLVFSPIIIPSNIRPKRWTLSLAGGTGYAFHSIMDSLRTKEMGIGHTKTVESYVADLALSRRIKRKWDLSLGLQYQLHYRRFNAVYFEYITDDRTPTINKNAAEFFHKYQQFDLKAALGRSHRQPYFNFSYGAGLGANLNFQVSGQVLDPSNRSIDLNALNTYRKTLQPYFFGYARVSRSLRSNLQVYTEMEVKSTLRFDAPGASFSHRALPIYGKLGLAFWF